MLTRTGWTIILRYSIQSLVPQCRGNFLSLPAGSSLRAGISFATSFVRYHHSGLHIASNKFSADLEMTVNMLIQIDKLVQLLESPVFTCKLHPPPVNPLRL